MATFRTGGHGHVATTGRTNRRSWYSRIGVNSLIQKSVDNGAVGNGNIFPGPGFSRLVVALWDKFDVEFGSYAQNPRLRR
ncbi:MAG: hypothetical protein ACREHV_17065 [Rhizomicrobium sp.]